jgi:hypothetical protein
MTDPLGAQVAISLEVAILGLRDDPAREQTAEHEAKLRAEGNQLGPSETQPDGRVRQRGKLVRRRQADGQQQAPGGRCNPRISRAQVANDADVQAGVHC